MTYYYLCMNAFDIIYMYILNVIYFDRKLALP